MSKTSVDLELNSPFLMRRGSCGGIEIIYLNSSDVLRGFNVKGSEIWGRLNLKCRLGRIVISTLLILM
jgi:hypothetical protein